MNLNNSIIQQEVAENIDFRSRHLPPRNKITIFNFNFFFKFARNLNLTFLKKIVGLTQKNIARRRKKQTLPRPQICSIILNQTEFRKHEIKIPSTLK